jgi:hypothetical protein
VPTTNIILEKVLGKSKKLTYATSADPHHPTFDTVAIADGATTWNSGVIINSGGNFLFQAEVSAGSDALVDLTIGQIGTHVENTVYNEPGPYTKVFETLWTNYGVNPSNPVVIFGPTAAETASNANVSAVKTCVPPSFILLMSRTSGAGTVFDCTVSLSQI